MVDSVYHPDNMKARFKALKEQEAAIVVVAGPLREARDNHANSSRDVELAMNREIKLAEKGLSDIQRELAVIVRALGGRVFITAEPAKD